MQDIYFHSFGEAGGCWLLSIPIDIRNKIYEHVEQDSEVRVFGRNYAI